jgi:hypothetical protein
MAMHPGGMIPKRRSKLSLDGNVAGIPFTRPHGGRHYATAPIGFGGFPDQYDPGRMFYQDMSSHYRSPDPWFEHFHVRSTPSIRLNPPDRHFTPHVRYNDGLITPELTEEAFQETMPDEPVPPMPLEDVMLGPRTTIHGTPTAEEESMMADGINNAMSPSDADMLDAFGPGMEMQTPMPAGMHEVEQAVPHAEMGLQPAEQAAMPELSSELPAPHSEMAGLEQIVDGLMPGTADPMDQAYGPQMTSELFEQAMHDVLEQQTPEPMQPDPYAPMQEMYDEQLAMLMNPYAAPAPGMPAPGMLGGSGMGPLGPLLPGP